MPLWVRTVLITATPDDAAAATEGHVRQLRDLRAEGKSRAAGAFPDGDGFLDIFEAKDLRQAEAIARSSPLVDEGLATWMLREWREVSD